MKLGPSILHAYCSPKTLRLHSQGIGLHAAVALSSEALLSSTIGEDLECFDFTCIGFIGLGFSLGLLP